MLPEEYYMTADHGGRGQGEEFTPEKSFGSKA
jgi:hypothetical protein